MALKDEELIRFAQELKGEAPVAWHNFVLAVRAHAAREAGNLVAAPADNLAKAQGYALAFHQIADTLHNVSQLFDQMHQQTVNKARSGRP